MSNVGKFDPTKLNKKYNTKKRFYLEDGSNVYRILPPFKTENIQSYWQVYWMVGSDSKKRPVVSPLQKGRDGTVLVRCPITDKLSVMSKQLEKMKADPKSNPKEVEALENFLKANRIDKGYYYNVMNLQGEIGVLKVNYKQQQAIKALLKELYEEGIDPINEGEENGVFLDIKLSRDDRNQFVVNASRFQKKERDPQTKEIISRTVRAPIGEEVIKRMDTEAEDLTKLFKIFSHEELASLATFDPKAVDRLFARPEVVEATDDDTLNEELEEADPVNETKLDQVATQAAKTAATVKAAAGTTKAVSNSVVQSFLMGEDS